MTRRVVTAIEWGIALGLLAWLVLFVRPTGVDDFSRVLWPAGRAADPYQVSGYFYPVWNTWMLRALALLPRGVGLAIIWAGSLLAVILFSRLWGTPAWMALLAPPFVAAMLFGHPFEALVFAGVSLVWWGWVTERSWVMGVGLALCLFKIQLGLLPAIVGAYVIAEDWRGNRWPAWAIPIGMFWLATCLEFLAYGVEWWIGWGQALGQVERLSAEWNASPVQAFHILSWCWLPIGLWLWCKVQKFSRRLWVAMAIGLLISPYWAGYSLYPLVAMAGCWRADHGQG